MFTRKIQASWILSFLVAITFTHNDLVAAPDIFTVKQIEELEVLAQKGDVLAQGELAWRYHYGLGVATNRLKAFLWASKASSNGSLKGQFILSRCLFQGLGVSENKDRARLLAQGISKELLKKVSEDNSDINLMMGCYLYFGFGIQEDKNKGFEFILKSADAGNAAANFQLAALYLYGMGLRENTRLARVALEKATKAGSVQAMAALGQQQVAQAKDEKEKMSGLENLKKAAEKGEFLASIQLAELHQSEDKKDSDEKSLLYANRAIEISKKTRRIESLEYIEALYFGAISCWFADQDDLAFKRFKKVRELLENHHPHLQGDLAYVISWIGELQIYVENINEARDNFDNSFKILMELENAEEHEYELAWNKTSLDFFSELARTYHEVFEERHDQALQCVERAIDIWDRTKQRGVIADLVSLKIEILSHGSSPVEVIKYGELILKNADFYLKETTPRGKANWLGIFHFKMGVSYNYLELNSNAQKHNLLSLNYYRQAGNKGGEALANFNLISDLVNNEKYVEAEKKLVLLHDSVLNDQGIEDKGVLCPIAVTLSASYLAVGNKIKHREWALKAWEYGVSSNVPYLSYAAAEIVSFLYEENPQRALKYLEKLNKYEGDYFTKYSPERQQGLSMLGEMYLRQGMLEKAKPIAKLLLEIERRDLNQVSKFLDTNQNWKYTGDTSHFDFLASLGMSGDLAEAIIDLKGFSIASAIEEKRLAAKARDKNIKFLIDEVASLNREIASLEITEDANDIQTNDNQNRNLDNLKNKKTNVRNKIADIIYNNSGRRPLLDISLFDLKSNLEPHSVIVDFIVYYDRRKFQGPWGQDEKDWDQAKCYGAVLLKRIGEPTWIPLGSGKRIESLVEGAVPTNKKIESSYDDVLQELHAVIMQPILSKLPENVKTLIISPDSNLNKLNFAVLLNEENRFLCQDFDIKYVAAARDIVSQTSNYRSENPRINVFSDPSFGFEQDLQIAGETSLTEPTILRDSLNLNPLPGTKNESAYLKSKASEWGIKIQVSEQHLATEANLRKIEAPHILHFATHGFFLPDNSDPQNNSRNGLTNPMHRSGLALAGAKQTLELWGNNDPPEPSNDGILTAAEACLLDLTKTWLVVLSACDTGRGKIVDGQGVMGLRSAFTQAGAQNVLMTLWPVSDKYTTEFIKAFYDRAMVDGDAPQAMADVQREFLIKYREKFKDSKSATRLAVQLAGPFILSFQGNP